MAEIVQIPVRKDEILVADASRYVVKKETSANYGKEVVSLTYLNYGKPAYITLGVEDYKKFFGFTPGEGKESLKNVIGKKCLVTTTFSVA